MAISTGSNVLNTDVFNKFAETVVAAANAGIVYGTNSLHFADQDATTTAMYGGTTSGVASQGATNIATGDIVTGSTILNYILNQARSYCRIRNMSVTRTVTGGSSETRSGITHTTNVQSLAQFKTGSDDTKFLAGAPISATELNSYFNEVRDRYLNVRNNFTLTSSFTVCHVSCHSSCHGSRGRR
jgi:hypothetical protein